MEKFGKLVSRLLLPVIAEIIYSSLKSFFLNDIPVWNFEVTLFLYGTFFMLGSAYCHLEKKHVAVEVLCNYVSPGKQRALRILEEVFVLFVALAILYVSVPAAYKSFLIRERSTHQTPFNPQVWWFRCIIPISCALISWQAARDMYRLIRNKGLRTPEMPETPETAKEGDARHAG